MVVHPGRCSNQIYHELSLANPSSSVTMNSLGYMYGGGI